MLQQRSDIATVLSPTVKKLLGEDVAPKTKSGYKASYKRFVTWAQGAKPAATTVINYVGFLYDQRPTLAYATIRSYIDGVRHEVAVNTGVDVLKAPFENSLDKRYQMILRAIRRQRSGKRLKRDPITLTMLSQLLNHPNEWFNDKPASAATVKAAQSLAFFALTRIGEITAAKTLFDAARNMTRGDVKIHRDSNGREFLSVRIKNSKTALWGQHQVIAVYATGCSMCPVAAIRHLTTVQPAPDNAPIFTLRNGDPLTREAFVTMTREVLRLHGHEASTIMSHSFRKGGATRLAMAKVPEYVIKAAGRWKSGAYFSYIEATTGIFEGVSRAMLRQTQSSPTAAQQLIEEMKLATDDEVSVETLVRMSRA